MKWTRYHATTRLFERKTPKRVRTYRPTSKHYSSFLLRQENKNQENRVKLNNEFIIAKTLLSLYVNWLLFRDMFCSYSIAKQLQHQQRINCIEFTQSWSNNRFIQLWQHSPYGERNCAEMDHQYSQLPRTLFDIVELSLDSLYGTRLPGGFYNALGRNCISCSMIS